MVILGGLEIVAAGYLLNEFNKDKVDERERRKKRRDDEGRPHSHSRPDRKDSHRPPQQNLLQPPSQRPGRASSAPPTDFRPGDWQPQQQQQQRPPQYQNTPPPPGPGALQHANTFQPQQPPNNPYLLALHNDQHFPPQPAPWQHQQQGPPGPGHLQHSVTFQNPPQGPQPHQFMQPSQTFPIQQQQQQFRPNNVNPNQYVKPPPQGPLFYVDSKTGKVSHNLYPADHPMARGQPGETGEASRELWGDDKYKRTLAGDINTGLMWSERDEDDLAYGKDYSNSGRRRRRRSSSYERRRDR